MDPDQSDNQNELYHQLAIASAVSAAALATVAVYSSRGKLTLNDSMKHQLAIVTGASSGVGYACAKGLAARNATVVMACRDLVRGRAAAEEIKRLTKNENISVEYVDVADLSSVAQFATKIDRCHVLINNAGAMIAEQQYVTACELTTVTNHIGPFYLTTLLAEKLHRTAREDHCVTRVSNVGSRLEKNATPNKSPHLVHTANVDWMKAGPQPYNMWESYANSKLCNLVSTYFMADELNARYASATAAPSVTANANTRTKADQGQGQGQVSGRLVTMAVTPGVVNTNLNRFLPWWQRTLLSPLMAAVLRTPDQGAAPLIALAAADDRTALACHGGFFGSAPAGSSGGKKVQVQLAGSNEGEKIQALGVQLVSPVSAAALSKDLQRAVWQQSEALVAEILSSSVRGDSNSTNHSATVAAASTAAIAEKRQSNVP